MSLGFPGEQIASVSAGGKVQLWGLDGEATGEPFPVEGGASTAPVFKSDGAVVVSAADAQIDPGMEPSGWPACRTDHLSWSRTTLWR